ncbi:MAG: hypothetical protein EBZ69_02210 [Alphaproteobacteria bacterium]|nr:hypothetical protein [Alphaproteobacteria bacterium]NDG04003.1 hypothetical protein [Alphaproteobacteria bacterium]
MNVQGLISQIFGMLRQQQQGSSPYSVPYGYRGYDPRAYGPESQGYGSGRGVSRSYNDGGYGGDAYGPYPRAPSPYYGNGSYPPPYYPPYYYGRPKGLAEQGFDIVRGLFGAQMGQWGQVLPQLGRLMDESGATAGLLKGFNVSGAFTGQGFGNMFSALKGIGGGAGFTKYPEWAVKALKLDPLQLTG